MKYPESKEILKKIKEVKRILINCHRNPDLDSVGSAIALFEALKGMGKDVKIISPTAVQKYLDFIPNFDNIEVVDFLTFDFNYYDIFVTLDSSSWQMISNISAFPAPNIPTIVIDHHKTNEKYGFINIVDEKVTSTGEILFTLFEDWRIPISNNMATSLMAGIIGDTGIFKFPGQTANTFLVVSKLISLGADKDDIVFRTSFSVDPLLIKFWGKMLGGYVIDREYKFAYTSIDLEEFKLLGSPESGRELTATSFGQIINGTDFGIIMVEQEKNVLSISLRSRTGVDVSVIAKELGGGGHRYAAGAKLVNIPYKEAVDKVLMAAREFVKSNVNEKE